MVISYNHSRWVGSVSYYSSVVFCPVSYFFTVSYYFWNFCRKYGTGLVGCRINTKMVFCHYRINTILEYTAIVFFKKKKFGDFSIVFIGQCRIYRPVSYFHFFNSTSIVLWASFVFLDQCRIYSIVFSKH